MGRVIGTLDWSARTGGRLVRRERWRLTLQAALAQVALRLRGMRGGTGPAPDLDALRVPDSPAAEWALEHAAALGPAWLTSHCVRAYLWGALLAQRERRRFDEAQALYEKVLDRPLDVCQFVLRRRARRNRE